MFGYLRQYWVAKGEWSADASQPDWQSFNYSGKSQDGKIMIAFSAGVESEGEQYRISPTGTVDGQGQIRAPLENIVSQYIE